MSFSRSFSMPWASFSMLGGLTRFLQSEVKIIHIIVQNNTLKITYLANFVVYFICPLMYYLYNFTLVFFFGYVPSISICLPSFQLIYVLVIHNYIWLGIFKNWFINYSMNSGYKYGNNIKNITLVECRPTYIPLEY